MSAAKPSPSSASWKKRGKVYRLKHPQVSGTLEETTKGTWLCRLSAGGATFGFCRRLPDARAAKVAAEQDIGDLVTIHELSRPVKR